MSAKIARVEPLIVRPSEAARMLGFGKTKIFELIGSGELPSFLIGRSRVIEVAEIKRWLDRQKAA